MRDVAKIIREAATRFPAIRKSQGQRTQEDGTLLSPQGDLARPSPRALESLLRFGGSTTLSVVNGVPLTLRLS